MTSHVDRRLRATVFLAIYVAVLAGGCNHPRSTPEDAIPVSDQPLITLLGKQVTVRGEFSLAGKIGPYIKLENRQVVYFVNRSEWGSPYSEMEGKLVEATGTLRFYHDPPADPTERRIVAHAYDHFYFDAETTQLRLIGQ